MNPMALIVLTFQRTFYVKTLVKSTITHLPIKMLPVWQPSSYLYLNLLMLVIMIGLFLISLIIFGRLEGNFESEL
jgi:hypothetical protein